MSVDAGHAEWIDFAGDRVKCLRSEKRHQLLLYWECVLCKYKIYTVTEKSRGEAREMQTKHGHQ